MKKKSINSQIKGLKKQKLMLKMDKINKQKTEIQKSMNKFVNGASSFNN